MSFSSYNGYKLNSHLTCFQQGFITQLVEASHRYRGGHGFESPWSLIFFLGFLCNCLVASQLRRSISLRNINTSKNENEWTEEGEKQQLTTATATTLSTNIIMREHRQRKETDTRKKKLIRANETSNEKVKTLYRAMTTRTLRITETRTLKWPRTAEKNTSSRRAQTNKQTNKQKQTKVARSVERKAGVQHWQQ